MTIVNFQWSPSRIFDPTLLALAGRVEVEVVDRYEQLFPAKTIADVEVITHLELPNVLIGILTITLW